MKLDRTTLPWLGLAAICLLYIGFIARLHPINLFGITQDDSVYFSSAKALAQGAGYILPSLPGKPPAANKYPIFYPWMLSWAWRWNPSFPSNINDGVALTAGFGLAYITFSFLFLRRSMKTGDAQALLLTAFCAFHPIILYCSASILSDIPFAALSLGSLVIADRAMQRNGNRAAAIACGILAGLSILTRTTGYPVVLGILAIAILRKARRQAAAFGSTVAVFAALFVWEKLAAVKANLPAGWATLGPGFRQTWLYYTDYPGFRKLSVVGLKMVVTIFFNQFLYMWAQIPGYFLSSFFDRHVLLLFTLTVVLLWLIFTGFVQTIRLDGWKPIHAALILYVGLVLAWNYPQWNRFLIPFLPAFAASLWMGVKQTARELSRAVRSKRPRSTRVAALVLAFTLAILTLVIAWDVLTNGDRRDLFAFSLNRAELLIEKRQAYDWLKANSPADSRIVAGEDVCAYLYTGRESMAFIAMLPIGSYEPHQMQSDLDHMTDVATDIGAAYWLGSIDDSDKQLKGMKVQLAARLGEIQGVLPELFRSSSGNVRIYDARCFQHPEDAFCRSADHVLFPEGHAVPSASNVVPAGQ